MNIYTKTGDKGETALIGGTRVSKSDLRLETYGTADELNSFVGLLRAQNLPSETDIILHEIQNRLFTLGAYLATDQNVCSIKPEGTLKPEYTEYLEKKIDLFSENLPPMQGFILPTGNQSVALCHVCRTITRRLERKIVAFKQYNKVDNSVLEYINRLSDFFFVLSRKLAIDDHCKIFLWEK